MHRQIRSPHRIAPSLPNRVMRYDLRRQTRLEVQRMCFGTEHPRIVRVTWQCQQWSSDQTAANVILYTSISSRLGRCSRSWACRAEPQQTDNNRARTTLSHAIALLRRRGDLAGMPCPNIREWLAVPCKLGKAHRVADGVRLPAALAKRPVSMGVRARIAESCRTPFSFDLERTDNCRRQ